MKLNICVLSLLVSQILAGHEPKPEFGNYPDICTNRTADVLKLTPTECDPTGRAGPDIQVGSTLYPAGKYSHMVIGRPGGKGKSGKKGRKVAKEPKKSKKGGKGSMPVVVYLPGTTDWPALSSCLLESVSKTGYPVIGLNHAYLRRGDSFRNARCESLSSLEEQVFCLEQHHIDAIYGGDYGSKNFLNDAEFWQEVDARDSIEGRLGLLLKKLDNLSPNDGWGSYYSDNEYPMPPTPEWSEFIVMGHSQGAGHAAYLAKTRDIRGAALISGPQDECINCPQGTKLWIDEPFETTAVTGFAQSGEGLYSVIEDNWNRMDVSWSTGVPVDVDFALDDNYDLCQTPIVSSVDHNPHSPCGGSTLPSPSKRHCSTALDDSAPRLEKINEGDVRYIYGLNVWPNLATEVLNC